MEQPLIKSITGRFKQPLRLFVIFLAVGLFIFAIVLNNQHDLAYAGDSCIGCGILAIFSIMLVILAILLSPKELKTLLILIILGFIVLLILSITGLYEKWFEYP